MNQKFNSSKGVAGGNDTKVLSNIRNFMEGEGKGKDVRLLTFEALGGKNQERENMHNRVLNEQGVPMAPESEKLERVKIGQTRKNYIYGTIEEIYEAMPDLRGKMITRKVTNADGALARATPPPRVPSTPKSNLLFRGTLGSGLKIAGAILIQVIVSIALNWLLKKYIEKWQQDILDADMKRDVTPKLIAAIDTKRWSILENIREGKKAFAKVVFRYFKMNPDDAPLPSPPGFEPPERIVPADPFLHVQFDNLISITDQKMDQATTQEFFYETVSGQAAERFQKAFGPTYSGERVTFTIEFTYTQDEIDLFRAYRDLIMFCMSQYLSCRPLEPMEADPEDIEAQKFWADLHRYFVSELDKAIKEGPPPTML